MDFVLGNTTVGATDGLFGGQDASLDLMRTQPEFVRAYWRGFQDAVDGPLQASAMNPMLDAKYTAFLDNGINSVENPGGIKNYVATRRSFLISQLASVASPFTVNPSVSVNGNLATITGTAPVGTRTILINGVEYQLNWTSVSNWTASVVLESASMPTAVLSEPLPLKNA